MWMLLNFTKHIANTPCNYQAIRLPITSYAEAPLAIVVLLRVTYSARLLAQRIEVRARKAVQQKGAAAHRAAIVTLVLSH